MRAINRNKMKARITDENVLDAYSKYETYLKELNVVEEVEKLEKKLTGRKLMQFYKENHLDLKNCQQRFRKIFGQIKEIKKENPDIDLRDISTSEGREIVSGIIAETQDDQDFKTADLLDVAMAENLPLYVALEKYNEKKESKEMVLVHYDLSEQQFDALQERYETYKEKGIVEKFNQMCKKTDGNIPSKFVNYAAAALDERPVNALEALRRIGIVEKEKDIEITKNIKFYSFGKAYEQLLAKKENITDKFELQRRMNEIETEAYLKTVERLKKLVNTEREGEKLTITREGKLPEKIVNIDTGNDEKREAVGAERD